MNSLIPKLGKSALFKGYTISDLERIFTSFRYRLERYNAKSVVRLRGTVYDEPLLPLDGKAVAEMQDESGKVCRVEKRGS